MPIRHFLINGEDYGTGPATHIRIAGDFQSQSSEALFCPACGEVWARMPVEPFQPYVVTSRICEKHGNPTVGIGGTIWKGWGDRPDKLPKKVLYRELELNIKFYENY